MKIRRRYSACVKFKTIVSYSTVLSSTSFIKSSFYRY